MNSENELGTENVKWNQLLWKINSFSILMMITIFDYFNEKTIEIVFRQSHGRDEEFDALLVAGIHSGKFLE